MKKKYFYFSDAGWYAAYYQKTNTLIHNLSYMGTDKVIRLILEG